MGTIYHNFTVGETVWVIYNSTIVENIVVQVDLEVDPSDDTTTVDKITYHVDMTDVCGQILVMDQSQVFGSLADAMDFIEFETIPANSNTYNISYTFDVFEVVWTFHIDRVLEGVIKQISLNLSSVDEQIVEEKIYHVLPVDTNYSTLEKTPGLVFATQAEALAYMDTL